MLKAGNLCALFLGSGRAEFLCTCNPRSCSLVLQFQSVMNEKSCVFCIIWNMAEVNRKKKRIIKEPKIAVIPVTDLAALSSYGPPRKRNTVVKLCVCIPFVP